MQKKLVANTAPLLTSWYQQIATWPAVTSLDELYEILEMTYDDIRTLPFTWNEEIATFTLQDIKELYVQQILPAPAREIFLRHLQKKLIQALPEQIQKNTAAVQIITALCEAPLYSTTLKEIEIRRHDASHYLFATQYALQNIRQSNEITENNKNIISELFVIEQAMRDITSSWNLLPGKRPKEESISISVEDFFKEKLPLLESYAQGNNITLKYKNHAPNAQILIPPSLFMSTVIMNIYTNAIAELKKIPRTDKVIRIHIALRGETVAISIIDNGAGILPEHIKLLNSGKAHTTSNSGFGLQSAHTTIKALHGKMKIASKFGQHTVVSLQLPLETRPAEHLKPNLSLLEISGLSAAEHELYEDILTLFKLHCIIEYDTYFQRNKLSFDVHSTTITPKDEQIIRTALSEYYRGSRKKHILFFELSLNVHAAIIIQKDKIIGIYGIMPEVTHFSEAEWLLERKQLLFEELVSKHYLLHNQLKTHFLPVWEKIPLIERYAEKLSGLHAQILQKLNTFVLPARTYELGVSLPELFEGQYYLDLSAIHSSLQRATGIALYQNFQHTQTIPQETLPLIETRIHRDSKNIFLLPETDNEFLWCDNAHNITIPMNSIIFTKKTVVLTTITDLETPEIPEGMILMYRYYLSPTPEGKSYISPYGSIHQNAIKKNSMGNYIVQTRFFSDIEKLADIQKDLAGTNTTIILKPFLVPATAAYTIHLKRLKELPEPPNEPQGQTG